MEKVTKLIAEISSKEQEKKIIIEYGIEQGKNFLNAIIITLFIGLYFGMFWKSFLFLMLLMPLRMNAGGYHADSKLRCYIISSSILIVCFYCLTKFNWTLKISLLFTSLAFLIIFYLAPVQNSKKDLDLIEKTVYQHRVRYILYIESFIFVIAVFFGWQSISNIVMMTFLVVSILLITGFMKEFTIVLSRFT